MKYLKIIFFLGAVPLSATKPSDYLKMNAPNPIAEPVLLGSHKTVTSRLSINELPKTTDANRYVIQEKPILDKPQSEALITTAKENVERSRRQPRVERVVEPRKMMVPVQPELIHEEPTFPPFREPSAYKPSAFILNYMEVVELHVETAEDFIAYLRSEQTTDGKMGPDKFGTFLRNNMKRLVAAFKSAPTLEDIEKARKLYAYLKKSYLRLFGPLVWQNHRAAVLMMRQNLGLYKLSQKMLKALLGEYDQHSQSPPIG